MKLSNLTPVANSPIFAHDCASCTYLGTHRVEHDLRDAYLCGTNTIILRYGDQDGDNSATPFDCIDSDSVSNAISYLKAQLLRMVRGTAFYTNADKGRTYLGSYVDRTYGVVDAFLMFASTGDHIVLQWGLLVADRKTTHVADARKLDNSRRSHMIVRHALETADARRMLD